MAVYKKCTKCGKKIQQYKDCECKIQAKRDSYNDYKRRRQDKDRQALYSSTTWIRLRDYIYRKYYGLCIVCLLKDNKIVNAEVVHHIEDVESSKGRELDADNLIPLCQSCHIRVHRQYDKNNNNKSSMQKILFLLLEKFNKEY